MMRAKERGRWGIAANQNVGLPGALTGKRPRETSLDSKATQLRRANEKTRWVNRYQFGRHRMSHQVRSSLKADEDRNGKTLTISLGLFAFMLLPLNLP
jgi:hypothetical protein